MSKLSRFIYQIRYCLKKRIFASCGKNVRIDAGVCLENPHNISIGDNVHLRHGCMLYACNGSSSENCEEQPYIVIGNNVHIKENVVINTYGGFVIIEDNCIIGQNSVIYGNGGVTIGKNSGLGPLCCVIASNHNYDATDVPFIKQGETKKGICIGDNVWCASGIIVCDGVVIKENSVIGAGSVVRKDVPANAVVLGNPAKIAVIR